MEIGTDIVENKRLINKDIKFIKKILTDNEYSIYVSKKSKQKKLEYLCGRVAIKEAIFKCLNLKSLDFNEVEVLNDKNGKPYTTFNNLNFKLSISHEKNYTIGIALLLV